MPVSPARMAAFEVLIRVEKNDAYASELLHSARFATLSAADHGLLTELVMGVVRWRSVIDSAIAGNLNGSAFPSRAQPARSGATPSIRAELDPALRKLDLEVLTVLRIGAYQLLFLDRVPRYAAVNEGVDLVKRAGKRSAAGLVNAVLRKIRKESFKPDPRAAHPEWLVERWERAYGVEAARSICEYDQTAPGSAIRLSAHLDGLRTSSSKTATNGPSGSPSASASILDELRAEGIVLIAGRLLTRAAIVTTGDVTRTKAFREHCLAIQDEASQLVALLVCRGQRILDCCAAPGGKTRILAEQNPGATIVALELHPHRAALLRKLVSAANVRIVSADARTMPFRTTFDRILVDAPCSGTGTLARNPEIKWRLKADDLERLQLYQIEILRSALKLLAPGGRLMYSTCSLESQENEAVVERALSGSLRVIDVREELRRLQTDGELAWEQLNSLARGPYLRTIPGLHPCDGFFAAMIERN